MSKLAPWTAVIVVVLTSASAEAQQQGFPPRYPQLLTQAPGQPPAQMPAGMVPPAGTQFVSHPMPPGGQIPAAQFGSAPQYAAAAQFAPGAQYGPAPQQVLPPQHVLPPQYAAAPQFGPAPQYQTAPGSQMASGQQYIVHEGEMPFSPGQEGEMVYMPEGQPYEVQEGYPPEGYMVAPYEGGESWMGQNEWNWNGDGRKHSRRHRSHRCPDPNCDCDRGGACSCGPGCGAGYGPECGQPVWYMRAEAVWLSRNDPPTRNLTVYDNDGVNPLEDFIVLSTDDLDLGTALGMRWTLGRYLSERTSIEGSFYGLHDWDDDARTPLDEANRPYDPYWGDDDESSFDVSNFEGAAQHVASYSSEFDSAELGIRRWVRPDTSLLIGFRYMRLDERLSLLSRDEGNVEPSDIGLYDVYTENDLFGVQIGTEFVHQLGFHWLYFNFEAKAGAYLNSSKHNSALLVTEPVLNVQARSEDEVGLARNAEISLGLMIQLTERFSLRGGYTANFINGVALAPDQLDTTPHRFNSRQYVNDDGTAVLHGAYFGGEWICD